MTMIFLEEALTSPLVKDLSGDLLLQCLAISNAGFSTCSSLLAQQPWLRGLRSMSGMRNGSLLSRLFPAFSSSRRCVTTCLVRTVFPDLHCLGATQQVLLELVAAASRCCYIGRQPAETEMQPNDNDDDDDFCRVDILALLSRLFLAAPRDESSANPI